MQSYTSLQYHIIFATKDRAPRIIPALESDLHAYICGIFANLKGVPHEIGGVADHLHVLVGLPPPIALSQAIKKVKAGSSRWLHTERPEARDFQWQPGFTAFTVSHSRISEVRRYIRAQKERHTKQSYEDELATFADLHGLPTRTGNDAPETSTSLQYHLIFATKDRFPSISPSLEPELHGYIRDLVTRLGGTVEEIDGVEDHVHILVKLLPTIPVSQTLHRIKGGFSHWVNEDGQHFRWQPGYAAFSVSQSLVPRVRQYIRNQKKHHRSQAFDDELDVFLNRHGLK